MRVFTKCPGLRLSVVVLSLGLFFFGFGTSVVSAQGKGDPPKKGTKNKLKIKHQPPKAAQVGRSLTLLCEIPDNDDLDEVVLRYRKKGDTTFRSLRMKLFGGDKYRAILQKFQIRKPALEYYIVGLDADKKWVPLFASVGKPHSLKIVTKLSADEQAKEKKAKSASDDLNNDDTSGSVFSAARREQRIQNAPGVITVITESEIRRGGWRTVSEVLRYSVGIDINHNGHSPDTGVRGINPNQSFGDKMIILVDGHNMVWRQFNRNLINPSWVNIENVKRIEIIRGPGSALWGANALSGVINIITKTNTDLNGFSASVGSNPLNQSYFLNLQGGQDLFGGITFRGSFSLNQTNGNALTMAPIYEFQKQEKSPVNYVPSGMQAYSQNFYGQLTWGGLSLRLHQSRYSPSAVVSGSNLIAGSGNVGGDDTLLATDRYIVRLSWTTLLGSWGTLSLWSAYDNYGFNRKAQLEVNPLSTFNSSPRLRGTSESFSIYKQLAGSDSLKFQGYYPACSELNPNSDTPCIKLTTGGRGELVCSLVSNPKQSATAGEKLPFSRYVKKECRHNFDDGRYTVGQAAQDHRIEAGTLLSVQIGDNFGVTAGLEFEYLYMLGYHFPEYQAYKEDPTFSNVHLSAYLQLQYNLFNYLEFTVGGRFDYDTQYNFIITPRASIVINPGFGLFGKLLYGNAFKAPSIQDRFLFIDRNAVLFGNPDLKPESVHTLEVQVGWHRRGLMAVSLNGYLSFFDNLIVPTERDRFDNFLGEEKWKARFGGENELPSRLENFVQKDNSEAITTYGGEFELRLFPARGFNILASFGLFLGQDSKGNPLEYASTYKGALILSYSFPVGAINMVLSAGTVVASPKKVPARAYSNAGLLPAKDVGGTSVSVPNWTKDQDPSLETPLYINSFVTLQLLKILKNIDLGVRLNNLLNREQYDANDILLYPQHKLELYVWMRVKI